MKKKIFLFGSLALVCPLLVMLVFSCTKDDQPSPLPLSDQKVDLRDDEEMPEEIAQYLTEAEIAAFWASKPTYQPPTPKEKGDKRPKKWRPFFVWGETLGRNFPVLSNCPDFANAEICWSHDDCPNVPLGPPLTPPLVGYVEGEGHMSGYGKVTQVWKRFVCSPSLIRLNGTYEKDDHRLHWRPLPGAIFSTKDGLYLTTLQIKVCNGSLPLDTQCWALSTGDFEDSEGIINYRIVSEWPFFAPPPVPFFATLPAYRIAWGWLWY